uniref:Uncharacterized protein n=1 Tax=Arundo donax TaxID=35708 RepID=A0A0A8YD36_ARUDO
MANSSCCHLFMFLAFYACIHFRISYLISCITVGKFMHLY